MSPACRATSKASFDIRVASCRCSVDPVPLSPNTMNVVSPVASRRRRSETGGHHRSAAEGRVVGVRSRRRKTADGDLVMVIVEAEAASRGRHEAAHARHVCAPSKPVATRTRGTPFSRVAQAITTRARRHLLKVRPAHQRDAGTLRLDRNDGGVVLRGTGRCREVALGREDDLIDGEAVLARLHANPLGARRLEHDFGTEHAHAPSVVLPSPACQPAARAVFEIHFEGGRGADPVPGGAAAVNAVRTARRSSRCPSSRSAPSRVSTGGTAHWLRR